MRVADIAVHETGPAPSSRDSTARGTIVARLFARCSGSSRRSSWGAILYVAAAFALVRPGVDELIRIGRDALRRRR
jgi:hypothetical protein